MELIMMRMKKWIQMEGDFMIDIIEVVLLMIFYVAFFINADKKISSHITSVERTIIEKIEEFQENNIHLLNQRVDESKSSFYD
jgi:hypothetical protein